MGFLKTVDRKKAKYALVVFVLLFLLAVTGACYSAVATGTKGKNVDHELYYMQADLVRLIEQALAEPLEPDYTIFDGYKGQFELDENTVQPEDMQAGTLYSDWLRTHLDGKILIDIKAEDDGCMAYVAYNPEEITLSVYSINMSGEACVFHLEVGDMPNVTAEVTSFSVVPVLTEGEEVVSSEIEPSSISEADTSQVAQSQSAVSSSSNTASSEVGQVSSESKEVDGSSVPVKEEGQGEAASKEPENPQPEEAKPESSPEEGSLDQGEVVQLADTAVPAAGLDVNKAVTFMSGYAVFPQNLKTGVYLENKAHFVLEEEPLVPPVEEATGETVAPPVTENPEDETNAEVEAETATVTANEENSTENTSKVVEGFETETGTPQTFDGIKSGLNVEVPANGMADMEISIGILYGGPLPGNERARVATFSSETAPSGVLTSSAGTTIHIYSSADKLLSRRSLPNELTGKDYATISTTGGGIAYELDENSTIKTVRKGSGDQSLTLELHNSKPVAVQQIDTTALEVGDTVNITSFAQGEASELDILNPAGNGIDAVGNFRVSGNVIVDSTGGDTGSGFAATQENKDSSLFVENKAELRAFGRSGGIMNVKNLVAGSGARIIANGNNTAEIAIEVKGEIYAHSNALVQGENAKIGIKAKDVVAKDGSDSYGDFESKDDVNKTRVVGLGSDKGMQLKGDIYSGRGSVIIGKGTYHGIGGDPTIIRGEYGKNNATGRPVLCPKGSDSSPALCIASQEFGTIYAEGTDAQSGIGYCVGERGLGDQVVAYGNRLTAVGGKYGYYSSSYGHYNIKAYRKGEIVAVGGTSGIQAECRGYYVYIWALEGGRIYGKGDTVGIYNEYGVTTAFTDSAHDKSNYDGSQIVAIGGVSDEDMSEKMDYKKDFFELPLPVPESDGTLPYVPGTYGIHNAGYGYIESFGPKNTVKMYGGEYGGRTGKDGGPSGLAGGTYVFSTYGGYIEAHSGRYGIVANSYVNVHSTSRGSSTLKAYGKEVGIWAVGNYGHGFLLSNNLSDREGYVYAYGEETAIRVESHLDIWSGQTVVAETLIDADAKKGADATPAIQYRYGKAGEGSGALPSPIYGGVVHEVYNVKNWDVPGTTADPYVINKEIAALGTQMSLDADAISSYDWTMPTSDMQPAAPGTPSSWEWTQYDGSNRGWVTAVKTPRHGLVASQSVKDFTLVANSKPLKKNGITTDGSVFFANRLGDRFTTGLDLTKGTFRITIKKAIPKKPKLAIEVPNLDYGVYNLSALPDTIRVPNDWTIKVTDKRSEANKKDWELKVKMTKPLTSTTNENHVLTNVVRLQLPSKDLIYLDKTLNTPYLIDTSSASKDITWNKDAPTKGTGIYLEVPTGSAYAETYKGTLTWTLVEGP